MVKTRQEDDVIKDDRYPGVNSQKVEDQWTGALTGFRIKMSITGRLCSNGVDVVGIFGTTPQDMPAGSKPFQVAHATG